jgi:hypothetical protein
VRNLVFVLLILLQSGRALAAEDGDDPRPGNCRQLLREASQRLAIGYHDFDQSDTSGWRVLRYRQCSNEALRLIDAYLRENAAHLRDNERANINFHAAQIALFLDHPNNALTYLRRSYLSTDTTNAWLDWNSYVRATYAFVTGDRPTFDSFYQVLASREVPQRHCEAGDQCMGHDANYSAVDRLRNCWGQPYRIAYYNCQAAPANRPNP